MKALIAKKKKKNHGPSAWSPALNLSSLNMTELGDTLKICEEVSGTRRRM